MDNYNFVPLKEHLERTTDLRISAIEKQLKDIIDSRIKTITMVAIIAAIISAVALVVNIIR